MPIYEYRCKECQEVTEVLQKFSDPPLTTCKSCGGTLERLISPPGLQFKGSGWYITDYARAGDKSAAARSPKDGKPAKKTETKTAETAAPKAQPKSD